MNVLIIGNGFDIALGLPTTYKEFLNFVQAFEDVFPAFYFKNSNSIDDMKSRIKATKNFTNAFHGKGKIIYSPAIDEEKKKAREENINKIFKQFHLAFEDSKRDIVIQDFHFCIHDYIKNNEEDEEEETAKKKRNNLWIDYFQKQLEKSLKKTDTWIGIEKEIRKVMLSIEDREFFYVDEENGCRSKIKYDIEWFMNFDQKNEKKKLPIKDYTRFIGELRLDFNKFILALNIYLDFFVRKLNKKAFQMT